MRFSAVMLSLVVAGCGGPSRPATAPTSGRVIYHGQPVTDGRIVFYPEVPAGGRPAIGAIGADGHYTLTTFDAGDGAVLGRHRVTIKAVRVTETLSPEKAAEQMRRGADLGVEWLVPKLYSRPETTPLVVEVKSGHNTIDFNLPAEDQP